MQASGFCNVYTSCIGLVKVRATVQTFRHYAKFSAIIFLPVCCVLKQNFNRAVIVLSQDREGSGWL